MRQRQALEGSNKEEALFEYATIAAGAGRFAEAQQILLQIWNNATGKTELAGAVAWTLGWVLVQQREHAQAATWFARATISSEWFVPTWPFVQTTLVNHFATLPAPASPATSNASLPPLRIQTLGVFQILRSGELLPPCNARKAVAVLRYLLTQPHFSAHKDQLAEQFWPNASAHEAGHSLRVAVATLRRYLDPPDASYLVFAANCYTIAPQAHVVCDAIQFQNQIEAGELLLGAGDKASALSALAGAIATYSGDYMVEERDGPWAMGERERLLIRYLTALDRLGRAHLNEGRFADAVECFRLLLERDGYREDACANLMHSYLGLGRRHDALRAFEQCRSLLRSDLGLEPCEQLTEVWHEVSAGQIRP